MKKVKIENEKLKYQLDVSVEKVDREILSGQFMEECAKCYENSRVNFYIFYYNNMIQVLNLYLYCLFVIQTFGELKIKQFDLKKNRERLGIECCNLLQRRSSLKSEILQLQEYLNVLSVCNFYINILYIFICKHNLFYFHGSFYNFILQWNFLF